MRSLLSKVGPLSLLLLWAMMGIVIPRLAHAQISFQHHSIKDGLPGSTVHAMLKDHQGYLWFGTTAGLARFDGYDFRVFTHDPKNKHSLSANTIADLYEDSTGKIWIGTSGGGLSIFDPVQETFFSFRHDPTNENSLIDDYVNVIHPDSNGRLWLGTNGGVDLFDVDRQSFIHFVSVPGKKNTLSYHEVNAIEIDPMGTVWVGTNKGLNRMYLKADNQTLDSIVWINRDPSNPHRIQGIRIKEIYKDPLYDGEVIWVGTIGAVNKVIFDPSNNYRIKDIIKFSHNPGDSSSLGHRFVSEITRDKWGSLWIGTFGGGLHFAQEDINGKTVAFTRIQHHDLLPTSLSGNKINTMMEDSQGLFWVGTESEGVSYFRLNRGNAYFRGPKVTEKLSDEKLAHWAKNISGITHYNRQDTNNEKVVQNISALLEDEQGWLWVGTENDGIDRIRPNTGIGRKIQPRNGLSHPIITTIIQQSKDTFWVGTFGGINRLVLDDPASPFTDMTISQFIHDPQNPQSLSNQHVFATYLDGKGNLWIGTRGGGLNRLDISSGNFERFLHDEENPYSISNDYVWHIISDGKNGLWLATDGGINHFDLESEKFTSYKHDPLNPNTISSDWVNTLLLDKHGILWAGTDGNGLDKLENVFDDLRVTHFRQNDGLPNGEIYAIEEDGKGNLWISTGNGLTRFNQKIPKDAKQFMAFQNFEVDDGLQHMEFYSNSSSKGKDGRIYFGGVGGWNAFYPDSVHRNKDIPPIVLTQINVLNKPILPDQPLETGRILLNQSLSHTDEICFSYKETAFSLEFAALNFRYPERNQYAYRLEGFDEEWIYSGNERKAIYTNLDAGDYVFHVKGSNDDGIWNEMGTSIKIHVSPPPWKTWWAYLLYVGFFLMGLMGYIRYQVETKAKIERAKQEERERVRKNASADFHDELGHKLTKISLFMELAKRQAPADSHLLSYLGKIEDQSQQLSEGIRDFIWVLAPEKDSLHDTLVRIKDFGDQLFEHTPVIFRTEGILSSLATIKLSLNTRRHLVMIVKEAMNNSLKYAQAKSVKLSISQQENGWEVTISDDGRGFDLASAKGGYGLGNMERRAGQMGAAFELKTELGVGTVVIIQMKTAK